MGRPAVVREQPRPRLVREGRGDVDADGSAAEPQGGQAGGGGAEERVQHHPAGRQPAAIARSGRSTRNGATRARGTGDNFSPFFGRLSASPPGRRAPIGRKVLGWINSG
jgi:hypothetical protein